MLATVLPVAVFMLILYRLWSVYAELSGRIGINGSAYAP